MMATKGQQLALGLGSLFLCLLSGVGCSDIRFDNSVNKSETEETLRAIQPALAVRGLACLMCHADIRANIITDFGYGNPWYFGGAGKELDGTNSSNDHSYTLQSWYTNVGNSWQSANQIIGSVYVPNRTVPAAVQNYLGSNKTLTIAEALERPYQTRWNWTGVAADGKNEMVYKVQPAAGKNRVISTTKVVIRSPSETEILNLAPSLQTNTDPSGFQRLRSTDAVELKIAGSGANTYVTNFNNTTLNCSKSSLVVKGTLLLRRLNINAAGGCRIYVTGTVFIEGPISYSGGGDQNLQISSANMISMGISAANLQGRLLNPSENRSLEISGSRNYSDRANQAVVEAQRIEAVSPLVDAADDLGGGVANDYSGHPRATIDFSGLLLNAPIIHSRYLGQVKGTIVAEAALFALGRFNFDFDPVFTRVSVFPELTNPVLVAK